MKKTILHFTAMAILMLLCIGQHLYAAGLGVNRIMSTESERPLQPVYPTILDDIMNRMNGIDIVYDTAVAKDRLFNYRANFECYTITERINTLFANYSRDTNHIVFSNTFGFGFVRSRYVRLWAGPQFSLSCEFIHKNNRILDSVIYNKIGGVAGANFHATEDITLGVEIGFRTGFGFDLHKSPADTFTGSRLEPIAAFKLIFRMWDSYPTAL